MRISDWSSDVCSSDLNTNPRPPRRRADVRRTCRRLPSRRGCRTMPQRQTEEPMKAVEAVCEILKRESIELIIGYPVNHVLEYAARADIRPVIVCQERVGLPMADAMPPLRRGQTTRASPMHPGPGAETACGGAAPPHPGP